VLDGLPGLVLADDPCSAMHESAAVVLLTNWPEFAHIDPITMARSVSGHLIVDGRNMSDPDDIGHFGFQRGVMVASRSQLGLPA
jgi:UDPglucose 6-dehydrogenase